MRTMALAFVFCMSISAFGVTVQELPQSDFADTEVSTNIAFVIDRAMMTRVEFTVALEATPTNSVEVAIGTDGNGDGSLSVEESAYVFGYDCGAWFVRDQSKSRVAIERSEIAEGLREEQNLQTCSADQPERARCPFHEGWMAEVVNSRGIWRC